MSQTQEEAAAPAAPPSLLTLANGQQLDLTTGKLVGADRATSGSSPSSEGPSRIVTRRSLVDAPLQGPQMRTMAAVASVELWGLQVPEIAEMFGVPEEKIISLRGEIVYKNFFRQLVRSVLDSELEEVREDIAKTARQAVEKVKGILNDETASQHTMLKAAQDLLDRSGLRAADIVEHRHSVQGGLKIVYEKRGDNLDVVKDVVFTEIKDGG